MRAPPGRRPPRRGRRGCDGDASGMHRRRARNDRAGARTDLAVPDGDHPRVFGRVQRRHVRRRPHERDRRSRGRRGHEQRLRRRCRQVREPAADHVVEERPGHRQRQAGRSGVAALRRPRQLDRVERVATRLPMDRRGGNGDRNRHRAHPPTASSIASSESGPTSRWRASGRSPRPSGISSAPPVRRAMSAEIDASPIRRRAWVSARSDAASTHWTSSIDDHHRAVGGDGLQRREDRRRDGTLIDRRGRFLLEHRHRQGATLRGGQLDPSTEGIRGSRRSFIVP